MNTMYQYVLQKSDFTEQLKCIASDNNREDNTEEKKQRKRKIIWFNPPYSINIRTNIDKTFLKLMKKLFPNGNPLNKMFNKNTLKVTYSCMDNMTSIIMSSNNLTILKPDASLEYGCNYRSRNEFPLQIKCLTPLKYLSKSASEMFSIYIV